VAVAAAAGTKQQKVVFDSQSFHDVRLSLTLQRSR